jgi:hypothetical protein
MRPDGVENLDFSPDRGFKLWRAAAPVKLAGIIGYVLSAKPLQANDGNRSTPRRLQAFYIDKIRQKYSHSFIGIP